jgi:hypothetical protein
MPVKPHLGKRKPKKGSHTYYKKRFKNVSHYDIREVYKRSRWILKTCDLHLRDTRNVHTDFFRFITAILINLGKQKTLDEIYLRKKSLYNLVREKGKEKSLKKNRRHL